MPRRFVIGQEGNILYAEVNPDYTRRPAPEGMLPALHSTLGQSPRRDAQ